MSIPASLYPGLVSIYGVGSTSGVNGMIPPTVAFKFGVIDQVWSGGGVWPLVGDSVMYNEKDVIAIIQYNNWPYTLIDQDKIVLAETVIV